MRWRRQPDVVVVVTTGQSDTALEAAGKMATFTTLCMRYDVRIVSTDGAVMTIAGRPKKVRAFRARFDLLSAAGAV